MSSSTKPLNTEDSPSSSTLTAISRESSSEGIKHLDDDNHDEDKAEYISIFERDEQTIEETDDTTGETAQGIEEDHWSPLNLPFIEELLLGEDDDNLATEALSSSFATPFFFAETNSSYSLLSF